MYSKTRPRLSFLLLLLSITLLEANEKSPSPPKHTVPPVLPPTSVYFSVSLSVDPSVSIQPAISSTNNDNDIQKSFEIDVPQPSPQPSPDVTETCKHIKPTCMHELFEELYSVRVCYYCFVDCMFDIDPVWNVAWPPSPIGTFAYRVCPGGFQGILNHRYT